MVNLTQPALLCFGGVPQEPSLRHHFLQVLAYLQAYKEVRFSPKSPWGRVGGGGEGEGGACLRSVPLFRRPLPVRRRLGSSVKLCMSYCSW